MRYLKRESRSARCRRTRGRVFAVEALEDRQLLSTAGTFTGPSLSGLIAQAWQGKDTSRAAINTMLGALQSQLTSGPLADLNSGTVDGNGFVSEVQSLVQSYDQNVDQQLLPHFVNIDDMLKLQGQRIAADVASLNQQETIGVITSAALSSQSQAAINSLTAGPIYSLGTPVSAYVTATQTFETNLNTLSQTLTSSSSTASISDIGTTLLAEAEAYRASMLAGLQVTHPNIASTVNQAVTTLENAESALDQSNATNAQTQLNDAIKAFDTAILDTNGLFGTQGPVNQVNAKYGYVPINLTVQRTSATLSSVSGTATYGGTADLTATLTSASGPGLAGQVVSFTLDGAFAGIAVTDSSGVATLTTPFATSDSVGTASGAVFASFPGDLNDRASIATGDLVVSQASTTTTLTSSSSTSVHGQSVTFTAVVAAVPPGGGTPAGTVDFMDGTTQVGTGALDSTGTATFSTSSLSVGTHSITAVYPGDTNYITSTSSALSHVVNQATTTTTLTSGTNPSVYGQSVTFTAVVAPVSPGAGTPPGTVNFLDGTTQIGTGALTSGTATFSTSSLSGTASPHSITAVYVGDTNFATSTSTAVSQVVNAAATTTTASDATATSSPSDQNITLNATVTSSGGSVNEGTETFTIMQGATVIGTAVTFNVASGAASGIYVLPGGTGTGTYTIQAVYNGTANFATSTDTTHTLTVA